MSYECSSNSLIRLIPDVIGVQVKLVDRSVIPDVIRVQVKLFDTSVIPHAIRLQVKLVDTSVIPHVIRVQVKLVDRSVIPDVIRVQVKLVDTSVIPHAIRLQVKLVDTSVIPHVIRLQVKLVDTSVIPHTIGLQVRLAVVFPDAIGVHDKVAITNLQCKILDCLHKYTCKVYPSESKRHARMLLRLPTLRTVSAKAAECFLSMSLDGSVKMNALVLEMMS